MPELAADPIVLETHHWRQTDGSIWGACVLPIIPGQEARIPDDEPAFPAADTNTLAIAYGLTRKLGGEPLPDTTLTIADDVRDSSRGLLRLAPHDYKLPLADTVRIMLARNDPTAIAMVTQYLGGVELINEMLSTEEGLAQTQLSSLDAATGLLESQFAGGVTTPTESALLLLHALQFPYLRTGLVQSIHNNGLRRRTEQMPYPSQMKDHKRGLSAAAFAKLVAHSAPPTEHPNKASQRPEIGVFNDVALIGKRVVSIMSYNHRPASGVGPHAFHNVLVPQISLGRRHYDAQGLGKH